MQEFHIFLKNEKRKFYDRFAIFIFILAILTTGIYLFKAGNTFLIYLAGILVLLLIFYTIIRKDLKVVIKNDGIIYPSFPSRKIGWTFISNLILKDDLLTIDMKNNHIIQQYIDDDKTKVNEKEFNEFCNQHLASSIKNPE